MERTLADEKQAVESNLNYLCSNHFQNVNRFIRRLQEEELLSSEDINALLAHSSNTKRLHAAFKIVKEKAGFFDKLIKCLVESDNKGIAAKLENCVQDFVVNENQLKRIRDVIIEDITVIRNWAHIKDEFVNQPGDLYEIETMIENGRHPAKFVLETMRKWHSKTQRATISSCIEKFRKMDYINVADKLNASKSQILESASQINQLSGVKPNSRLKSKNTCTDVAIWQQTSLIEQLWEKTRENEAEIRALKSKIEFLQESQLKDGTNNTAEVVELEKSVVERKKELTSIQAIIVSLQSEYNDQERVYTQDGGGVWKRLSLNKFTGIPKTKILVLRKLELRSLNIKVSTLLKALEDCKSLKELIICASVLRGEDENSEFRDNMLHLLDNCSPKLEVTLPFFFRVRNRGDLGQSATRAFEILRRGGPYNNWFEESCTDNLSPSPTKYIPRDCQALVLSCKVPENILNNFCTHFNVARLVLFATFPHYKKTTNQLMRILNQITATQNSIEYIFYV